MLRINLYSIFVDDQAKALRFYTDVLGFVKSQDIPVGGGYRWLTVRAADGGTELSLEPNSNPTARTYQQGLLAQGIPATSFETDDLQAEFERLRKAGVEFTRSPTNVGPVSIAVLVDTCGNLIQLHQRS
jgi:glyoxylase I family protein